MGWVLSKADLSLKSGSDDLQTVRFHISFPFDLLPEQKLSMKLVTIAALICQGKDAYAFTELSEFIRYYESIQQDYERSWIFRGTRNFAEKHKTLSATERNLLLTLINIWEFQKDKANSELSDLKTTIPTLLQEFQKAS